MFFFHSGGRDSVARVWDIRTKGQIHVLSGHTSSVNALISQPTDPQIISGSADSTIRYIILNLSLSKKNLVQKTFV
jgi:WD40 repeat protein